MPIGELFDLENLAQECQKRQRWTFFFSSVPLRVSDVEVCGWIFVKVSNADDVNKFLVELRIAKWVFNFLILWRVTRRDARHFGMEG